MRLFWRLQYSALPFIILPRLTSLVSRSSKGSKRRIILLVISCTSWSSTGQESVVFCTSSVSCQCFGPSLYSNRLTCCLSFWRILRSSTAVRCYQMVRDYYRTLRHTSLSKQHFIVKRRRLNSDVLEADEESA